MHLASPFWSIFCTSAKICRATVVLPEDSGPKISTIRPRGTPPIPSAKSKESEPVCTACTSICLFSPNFIIEPAPKSRSICFIAVASACFFPFSSSSVGTGSFPFLVDAIVVFLSSCLPCRLFSYLTRLLYHFFCRCQVLCKIYFSIFGIIKGILPFLDVMRDAHFPNSELFICSDNSVFGRKMNCFSEK